MLKVKVKDMQKCKRKRFEPFLSLLVEILDLVLIALTLIQTSLPKVSNQCNLIGTINVLQRKWILLQINVQHSKRMIWGCFYFSDKKALFRSCSHLWHGLHETTGRPDIFAPCRSARLGREPSSPPGRGTITTKGFLGDLWATLLFFRKLMGPCGEILSFSSQSSLPRSFRSLTTPSLNQKIRSSAAWIYGQLDGATEFLCQKSVHFYLLSSLLSVLLLSDLLHRPQKQFKLKHGNGCRPCFRDSHSTFWPVRTCL